MRVANDAVDTGHSSVSDLRPGPIDVVKIDRRSSFLLVRIGVQILWDGASARLASVPLHVR